MIQKTRKFTSEELTELEDIVRKSIELHEHTFGVEPRERGSYLEKMKEIKAFTEQEKLLKSLHLKVQAMCIEHPKERKQLELDFQGGES